MERRKWIWVDWLIFSLRCGWFGTGLAYYYVYSDKLEGMAYMEFFLFVSIGFLVPMLFWNPRYQQPSYYAVAELVVTGGFSIYINNILELKLSTSIILMPILMIGYLMTRRTAPWAIPLFVVLLPANRYWTMDGLFPFFLQYIDVLLFFGIGIGFNLITKSQQRYKNLLAENIKQYKVIQEQNQNLKQYAAQVEKLALVEERNRMARDLHDSIGHHFTSVTVGLDAVSYMIEVNPQLAADKIRTLAEVARSGLDEVRRTIHQIAPAEDDGPLPLMLERLSTDFAAHTGTEVEFESRGATYSIPPHVKLTFVRCFQECLTNAKRHGDAANIKASLEYKLDNMVLRVFNNGRLLDTEEFGFGLTSMKSRLEELNGSLVVENVESEGVTVYCTIPIGVKV